MGRHWLIGAAALLLACTACAGSGPVTVPTSPAPPLVAHLVTPTGVRGTPEPSDPGPICGLTRAGRGGGGGGLVTVDPDPGSVRATWIPGLNAHHCTVRTTTGTALDARQLAADIRSAAKVGGGTYNCPMDDGTAVRLVFGYGHGKRSEVVRVELTGCRWVTAPGRDARWVPSGLSADLLPLAPPAWRRFLQR